MDEPTSSPRFEFRSDLESTPLPEVLLTIYRYRVPGVVECTAGDAVKRIFIDQGPIIFATSNQTEDSLGDRLLARGVITRAQYEESVRRLKISGNEKRQGTILVEMGAMQPRDLFLNVRDQVQSVVWSIFDWESGTVRFVPGRDRQSEFIKLSIPIPEAVLQGVRQMGEARRLIARTGGKSAILERDETAGIAGLTLLADEIRLLESIDGSRTLYELVTSDPLHSPAHAAKLVYAFSLLGLIRVRASSPTKVQFRTSGQNYE
ncbi:MAG TPA: DUF4388 domain-containing protein [Thermoanaerobaculia bacterium]|nr:DUF4388 domain-containing protein [Thermoanaerobaculia bacterium]